MFFSFGFESFACRTNHRFMILLALCEYWKSISNSIRSCFKLNKFVVAAVMVKTFVSLGLFRLRDRSWDFREIPLYSQFLPKYPIDKAGPVERRRLPDY